MGGRKYERDNPDYDSQDQGNPRQDDGNRGMRIQILRPADVAAKNTYYEDASKGSTVGRGREAIHVHARRWKTMVFRPTQ